VTVSSVGYGDMVIVLVMLFGGCGLHALAPPASMCAIFEV